MVLVIVGLLAATPPWAIATPPANPTLSTWGASGAVRSELIIGNTLYLGGSFTSMISPDGSTTVARQHLAAIDLTTGDLLDWNPSANGAVLAMATDGTNVYIGGSFGTVNGRFRRNLAALDRTGALLPWNPKANGTVAALHRVGTTIYIGGAFTALGGTARDRLAAVMTSGALLAWDPDADARVNAITSVDAGMIVVGGAFTEVGGQSIDHIDGLDPLTGVSESWSDPSSQTVAGLVTGPDDNVYGAIIGSGGKVRSWTNDGHLRWTVSTDGDVNSVAYYDGQVIAGGHWVYVASTIKIPRLAAFNATTGAPDTNWKPSPNKQVWSLTAEGSTMGVGGVFTTVKGSTHRRVAVFDSA